MFKMRSNVLWISVFSHWISNCFESKICVDRFCFNGGCNRMPYKEIINCGELIWNTFDWYKQIWMGKWTSPAYWTIEHWSGVNGWNNVIDEWSESVCLPAAQSYLSTHELEIVKCEVGTWIRSVWNAHVYNKNDMYFISSLKISVNRFYFHSYTRRCSVQLDIFHLLIISFLNERLTTIHKVFNQFMNCLCVYTRNRSSQL